MSNKILSYTDIAENVGCEPIKYCHSEESETECENKKYGHCEYCSCYYED